MKRKHFLSVAVMLASVVLGGSLASCSGDDDSYIPSPTVTDKDGNKVQVTSVGNIRFSYDENGKLTSMSDGYDTYTLEDDKFSFEYDEGEAEVFLNSDALITKIEVSQPSVNGKATIEFSYSDRRLKKLSGTIKSSSFKQTSKVDYTWENGNMIRGVVSTKMESGKYSEDYNARWDFTYGTTQLQTNYSTQLPFYMGETMTDLDALGGLFSILGLLGYGPAYLPSGFTETEDDESPSTTNFSFTQNSNGTINTESRNGYGTIQYRYSNVSSRAEGVGTQSIKQYVSSLSNLFKHRRQ